MVCTDRNFGWMIRDLAISSLGTRGQGLWRRGMWMDILTRHRLLSMRLLNTRCLPQTRLNSHRDYNQICDGCQLLTPFTPQLAHQQSGPINRGRCYTWAQQHGCSFTKVALAAIADGPTCQHVNGIYQSWVPNMAASPRRTQPATWWQVDSIGLLPLLRGQRFFFF